MGKRGPAPEPTALKILKGNPGKRALNDQEPLPEPKTPTCPTWLDDSAKSKWKALVPELERLGLLTIVDGDTLATYCQAWAEFQHATKTLQKEGRTLGSRSHPAVNQQRTAWAAIKAFSQLFGLDPSSRTQLKIKPRDTKAQGIKVRQRSG